MRRPSFLDKCRTQPNRRSACRFALMLQALTVLLVYWAMQQTPAGCTEWLTLLRLAKSARCKPFMYCYLNSQQALTNRHMMPYLMKCFPKEQSPMLGTEICSDHHQSLTSVSGCDLWLIPTCPQAVHAASTVCRMCQAATHAGLHILRCRQVLRNTSHQTICSGQPKVQCFHFWQW